DRAGTKHLAAADNDAVLPLLDHPGIEVRGILLMSGFCPVNLRRHDRVRYVQVVVPAEFIETDAVLREFVVAATCHHIFARDKTDKEAGDVVWRAPHKAQ